MRHLLTLPVQDIQLVFGLEWRPLISGKAASTARRIARQRRATHLVMDGESPASFAFGTPVLAGENRGRPLHSAAQILARMVPNGSIACILPVASGSYWLVAVHEAAVMSRSDLVFHSEQQARDAYENLRESHPRLALLDPEQIGLTLASLATASDHGTALRDTGLRRSRRLSALFSFLVLGAACVMAYRTWFVPEEAVDVSQVASTEIREQWRVAVSEVEHSIALHGVAATHAVLSQVYQIPVRLSGWALARVECRAQGPLWRCLADLDRRHPHANSKGLMSRAPEGWTLSFPSIEKASATWEFHTSVQTAATQRLFSPQQNKRHLLSALQGIRMAFNRMELGSDVPIATRTPLDNAGRALPFPQGLPRYTRRPVHIEGPLRSLSLLLPYTQSIGWRSFSLVVGHPTIPTSATSRLRVTLHGELYEQLEVDT